MNRIDDAPRSCVQGGAGGDQEQAELMSIADQLARCDREIAEILARPDVASGTAPLWLVTIGIADWSTERWLIMRSAGNEIPT